MKKRIKEIIQGFFIGGLFACPISWCFIDSTNPQILLTIVIINLIFGLPSFAILFYYTWIKEK